MSDETQTTVQTKIWVLTGTVLILMTVVNFFFTREITNTGAKIEQVNESLNRIQLTVSTMAVGQNYLQDRVKALEEAKSGADATHNALDQRLNDLEKLVTRHDEQLNGRKDNAF